MNRSNRRKKDRRSEKVEVRPYTRSDGTEVGYHERSPPRKKDLVRKEKNIRTESRELIDDTKHDRYGKAEYESREIENNARALQTGIRGAGSYHSEKTYARTLKEENRNAKRIIRAHKRNERKEQKLRKRMGAS